ncbi:Hypothetical protein GLP15_733 [Giardia lamblia P15]|uniref:Uncharacterized protein n=1 Tax=Giardia intestinalis (strain P15) TaxID=658858 RepID=E1F405_GIAIA|nr:Hypothetical protein GLP15_733 [Giardia lamblia P15]
MSSRPSSSRMDAISTLMTMSQSVTRVGYVPAELQNALSKGLQRPVYASPPQFFSQTNPRLTQQRQRSPTRTIYQRPKRFSSEGPHQSVYVRNLANEVRTASSPEYLRRYPKQSFHTIQSASITYKIALSNHQTKLMHAPLDPKDTRLSKETGNQSIGGFRPINPSATATTLVNAKASDLDLQKHEQFQEDIQETFLTEPPIDPMHIDEPLKSPSPLAQEILDDDMFTEEARYLYPKVLTPDRRRLDRHIQASHGYVGKEFMEVTEKHSVGQKRLVAEKYSNDYIKQLPSSHHKIEKSSISKCSSNRDSLSFKQRSRSEYSQTSISTVQKQRDNRASVQVELSKFGWENAFIKKIDFMTAIQLEKPEPSTKPQEKTSGSPHQSQQSQKRSIPYPQLANMYTASTERKQRPRTSKADNLNEVRELVITSVAGQGVVRRRPVSAIIPQTSALPSTSSCDNLSSDGIKKMISATRFITNVTTIAPSKAETRDMCEFHKRTAQDAQTERNAALFNPNVADLFTRLGEQRACTFCDHYNKNRVVARRLVLTQILHLCRQHMCMQYFKCISIVHNPFQSTQLFLEWENHCIVIRACLQALHRLRFFHIIMDQLLYYLPEPFFNEIFKTPLNQLGLSAEALRSYFALKPTTSDKHNDNTSNKLVTSLSPRQDNPQISLNPKLSVEPEASVSAELFLDHKHIVDLSLIELSAAISEGGQQGGAVTTNVRLEDVNMDTSNASVCSSALPSQTKPQSIAANQRYLAPLSLEVAVAIISVLAEKLNIFARRTQRKSGIDGALLCGVIAFVGACNYDCYYDFINPVPLGDRLNTSIGPSVPKVRAKSSNNHGEAPITRILDYLCVEILSMLVSSYTDSLPSNLTYTSKSIKIPSTVSQFEVVTSLNKACPTDTTNVDWLQHSLYDGLIATVSSFRAACSKDRFAAEHTFLLEFNPQLSHRMFEAAAIVLRNMPVHIAAQHFDRVCLVTFCAITFIKGAIVSASTQKVITTIFQGVILHDPYTIANGYYLLSACISILLDMRIMCRENQNNTENSSRYLSYLLSELCLLSGIIVETHCLSLASGIALGNTHMMFSNYPSDINGALPPFIFFFSGAEDANHTDLNVNHEKTGMYLKYYVASFVMRLGISYIRYAGRLNVPVAEIITDSNVFKHLYREYSAYREKYALIDEFCRVLFEENKGLMSAS